MAYAIARAKHDDEQRGFQVYVADLIGAFMGLGERNLYSSILHNADTPEIDANAVVEDIIARGELEVRGEHT